MASSRTTNTFEEEMVRLVQTVAGMKTRVDADLPWVIELETMILDKIRSPERKLQELGLAPGAGQNPAGNAALGLPGGAPPMGGPGPMGGPPMGMSIPPSGALGSAPPPGMMAPGPGPSNGDLASILGVAA